MKTNLGNKMMRSLLGAVFALTVLFFCGTDVSYAAEAQNITLKTIGDYEDYTYDVPDITGLTASSVVTVTSNNTEVIGFCYDYGEEADFLVIRESEQTLKNGTWTLSDLSICSRHKGMAIATISVETDGVITTTTYNVTVEGTKPVFGKLSDKSIRTGDMPYVEISRLAGYASVTISSNKDKAFQLYKADGTYKKIATIGKKDKKLKPEDASFLYISPKKTGKIKINITIEQDGYTVKKTYQLNVTKYVNPIASFRIGQKDYAKKFDKRADIGDGAGLTTQECKYTLGGKAYSIKMKKGYKLVKITYRKYNEWGYVKPHRLKGSTLPKDFWELYIVYQDKKGKKWTNSINYSIDVFY